MSESLYGVLNNTEIKDLCTTATPMITPFVDKSINTFTNPADGVKYKIPSYGLSECGYDVRLGRFIKKPNPGGVHFCYKQLDLHDVKRGSSTVEYEAFDMEDAGAYRLEPGEFILGVTMEKFKMPADVMGICTGKSTLARMGLSVLVTPLEVSWEGYLTLELHNTSPNPIVLVPGMGVCQINFHKVRPVEGGYAGRNGKYMNQPYAPITPRL